MNYQNLKLSHYYFNENTKQFVHKSLESKAIMDCYDDLAELIRLVKFLRNHKISFKEDSQGNLSLIA